jgi:hypothetical protein
MPSDPSYIKSKKKSKKSKSKRHRRYSDESDSTDSEEEERRRRRRREKRKKDYPDDERERGKSRRSGSVNSDDERERRRRRQKSKSKSVLSPAPAAGKKDDWIEKEKSGAVNTTVTADIASDSDDGDMVGPTLPAEHKDKARRQAYVPLLSHSIVLNSTNIQIQRYDAR